MSRTETTAAPALLAARQRKGWSQYRLAVQADLHPNTISIAERTGHCTRRTAERLAAALDIPVESLLGEG
jgi:transcriptional regulator with XRE-family HTH domain